MELKFLGRGSAFNVKEGNTAAYFIDEDQLFLIDCGEDVFAKLKQKSLLGRVRVVNLMITHTHSDHIGSLGSLVLYLYTVLHKPLKIILPDNEEYRKLVGQILEGFGCIEEMYDLVLDTQLDDKFKSFSGVRYVKTWHCPEIMSFGLIFTTKEGLVYYSGDTKEIKNLHYLLSNGVQIAKAYVDVSSVQKSNGTHLFVGNLAMVVPEELRERIYCMHFNDETCIEMALSHGFSVVECEA